MVFKLFFTHFDPYGLKSVCEMGAASPYSLPASGVSQLSGASVVTEGADFMRDRHAVRNAWDRTHRRGAAPGGVGRRSARGWAVLAGLSLVAAGIVPVSPVYAAAGASSVLNSADEPVDCSAVMAPSEGAAREIAMACGTSVSVESLTDCVTGGVDASCAVGIAGSMLDGFGAAAKVTTKVGALNRVFALTDDSVRNADITGTGLATLTGTMSVGFGAADKRYGIAGW
ncbi:hypothetical protein [Myceligenerans indicum]|uniref:DUF4189 domain-containing protein n=1 Tax=Myceligenerans indicum TaxID=2593663 RepID=A0ABS1LIM7_9MICO|nr:hypothetical protein [Myceligenerans indicum]MBL0885894.1 hypothetical protein [Myceligenerans indicum]